MKVGEIIGRQIAELREQRGLSQTEFGARVGELLGQPWVRQSVWSAEQGRRAFKGEDLAAIAYVLGVSPGDLFRPPVNAPKVEMPSGVEIDRDRFYEQTLPADIDAEALVEMKEVVSQMRHKLLELDQLADTLEMQLQGEEE